MKSIKIYLGIIIVLLVIALGFGVYVWYTLQKLNIDASNLEPQTTQENTGTSSPTTQGTVTKPITVKTDSLSDTQQKILKSFGYTQDTLTITPAMVSCAENAVGKQRLAEILNGGSPSPIESVKLLPCFKK